MKSILFFLKSWQGLWAAVLMALAFVTFPTESISPTDGGLVIVAGSFLQTVFLWQMIFFIGIAGAWFAFQFDWHEIDKQLDAGAFLSWFNSLTPGLKIAVSLSLFFALLLWQACSLWLVVSLLR